MKNITYVMLLVGCIFYAEARMQNSMKLNKDQKLILGISKPEVRNDLMSVYNSIESLRETQNNKIILSDLKQNFAQVVKLVKDIYWETPAHNKICHARIRDINSVAYCNTGHSKISGNINNAYKIFDTMKQTINKLSEDKSTISQKDALEINKTIDNLQKNINPNY